MARLTNRATLKRTHLETAQVTLSVLLDDVDEVHLRNSQAMQRSPLVVPVLAPAQERLVEIRAAIVLAQSELESFWFEEREGQWKFEGGGGG